MTDATPDMIAPRTERLKAGLKRRYAREKRFKAYGALTIALALAFLALLLGRIIDQGHTAFYAHTVTVPVYLDPTRIDRAYPAGSNIEQMVAEQQLARLGVVDDAQGTQAREMRSLFSSELKFTIVDMLKQRPGLMGQTVAVAAPTSDDADLFYKGEISRETPEDQRRLNDRQLGWLDQMKANNAVRAHFNSTLFLKGDSTEPELAGVLGAVVGSVLMLLVTALIAIPVGVGAAVYLEEFAPKNRLSSLIEVNINNLAAVPSIVYGLLGLAVFINFAHLPRSASLVGGLVLTLTTLPTIIIATRAALKAVPPSIREAGLGIGASKMQTVFHHVLPLALPGMLTGTILGMARALGETAPLLMIGMRAFLTSVPQGFTQPATALPVQIFIWSDNVSRGFVEKTSGAIIVLLLFLLLINSLAIYLRNRFEVRW